MKSNLPMNPTKMTPDERVRFMIGDLMIQAAVNEFRIEQLGKRIQELEELVPRPTGGEDGRQD